MTEREKKSHAGCIIFVFLAPLPLLYVLSIGPFTWLVNQRIISFPTWAAWFYWPITYACDNHELIRRFFFWYQNLI
jgi:hypothetical protein